MKKCSSSLAKVFNEKRIYNNEDKILQKTSSVIIYQKIKGGYQK